MEFKIIGVYAEIASDHRNIFALHLNPYNAP
ncbi:hypothetical protein SAMN05216316_0856 [Nitrosovibrio sp. Nv6]|nr:hypothetical protein SAMN05216316_0856 [Nitrosovibrio sp. Nv6]